MTETYDPDDVWVYRGRLLRVVDGDTVYVLVDHGMHVHSTQSIRLRNVNAPEIFRGTDEEKAAGQAAKEFVEDWFVALEQGEWPLRIRTYKDTQSFNRYVADIGTWDGRDLADELVAAGHATWS